MQVELIGLSAPLAEVESAFPVDWLIADAGRTCYKTNDKATESRNATLIHSMGKHGHYSVLEHANATFRIAGISRACSHQLVRHRHQAISQQSQRYVAQDPYADFITPPAIAESETAVMVFDAAMVTAMDAYTTLVAVLLSEGRTKEQAHEDARFVLPNAAPTELVITPNFAELRHMFTKRINKHAQWEIRALCIRMLFLVSQKSCAFDDMVEFLATHDSLDGFACK